MIGLAYPPGKRLGLRWWCLGFETASAATHLAFGRLRWPWVQVPSPWLDSVFRIQCAAHSAGDRQPKSWLCPSGDSLMASGRVAVFCLMQV